MTFLKGARKYYEERKEHGTLHIPVLIPSAYYDDVSKAIENKVKEIEDKYNIHCIIQQGTADDVLASHHYANTYK